MFFGFAYYIENMSNSNSGLQLGETDQTAYRGDRGKTAFDHSQSNGNPHGTTKTDLNLENVDNTSDLNKPISSAAQTALNSKADLVAGKVPSNQLPAFVDDVLEFANLAAFPPTGESEKIYIALNTNLTYRWSGSTYVEISQSLGLGETASTAYRGDRGKAAYDYSLIGHLPLNGTGFEFNQASGLINFKNDPGSYIGLFEAGRTLRIQVDGEDWYLTIQKPVTIEP